MRSYMSIAAIMAVAGLSAVAAIPTITTKGAKFFDSEGGQFFIKGVAYQLTPSDPLVDSKQCSLDAALMKQLGANTIRVYHVDPEADHASCMKTFSDAGIYVALDLDTFDTQINPDTPHWNKTQHDAFAKVMDEFQQFDNLFAFFVGNEVLTMPNNSAAAPYVKAAARDMKAYRKAKGYRQIPIGYSAADIGSLRPNLQNYMACGNNASEALDFFSLNAYEWCGQSSYELSGYSMLQKNATAYNIPIFFSETGCQVVKPRTFDDQAAIFGSEMSGTWSGAIIYEWIQETNDYGLVSYGSPTAPDPTAAPDGFIRSGTPLPISPDFDNLSSQWAKVTPVSISADAYSPSNSPPVCPPRTSGMWDVEASAALPTLGQTYAANEGQSTASGASQRASSTKAPASTTSSSAANANSFGPDGIQRQLVGMAVALLCVMLGFVCWT